MCVHAEEKTTAAVLLLAELYKKRVHVCHVARKEEVREREREKRVLIDQYMHIYIISFPSLRLLSFVLLKRRVSRSHVKLLLIISSSLTKMP